MEFIDWYTYYVLHLDELIDYILERFGTWIYVILFGIIFAETGFIIFSFLPGDSLLFAAGTFAGLGELNIWLLVVGFFLAATLGDMLNFTIGRYCGQMRWVRRMVNEKNMAKAQHFFETYGGITVLLSRFMPVLRSLIPFVAGASEMRYRYFMFYNMLGALIWGVGCTILGYFLGTIPWVQDNFMLVIIAIMFTTIIPPIYAMIKARTRKR